MKKIILITTGGTIASSKTTDGEGLTVQNVSTTPKYINRLQEQYTCLIEEYSAFNKNSENITAYDWMTLIKALLAINSSSVDAILITHGTDTMANTVAVVNILAPIIGKKICFTGSFLPPEHKESDAELNLEAALTLLSDKQTECGVYLAFKGQIFTGHLVKPMQVDSTKFDGLYGLEYAKFNQQKRTLTHQKKSLPEELNRHLYNAPQLAKYSIQQSEKLEVSAKKVAIISLYPGIDFNDYLPEKFGKQILIMSAFHSGTCPVVEIEKLKKLAKQCTVFLCSLPSSYISTPYLSTHLAKEVGVQVIEDIQPHYIHAYCVLSLSKEYSPSAIEQNLSDWILK